MVLYETAFEAEDGTTIYAIENPVSETAEFKCFGKRYKRVLRRDGDQIGFIFNGRFYGRKEEAEK